MCVEVSARTIDMCRICDLNFSWVYYHLKSFKWAKWKNFRSMQDFFVENINLLYDLCMKWESFMVNICQCQYTHSHLCVLKLSVLRSTGNFFSLCFIHHIHIYREVKKKNENDIRKFYRKEWLKYVYSLFVLPAQTAEIVTFIAAATTIECTIKWATIVSDAAIITIRPSAYSNKSE